MEIDLLAAGFFFLSLSLDARTVFKNVGSPEMIQVIFNYNQEGFSPKHQALIL